MEISAPTAPTDSARERHTPITTTYLMGLGVALAAPSSLVVFDDLVVQRNLHPRAVSAQHYLEYGHEPAGTALSLVDSPSFDNFTASKEAPLDPMIVLSYVKLMAVLPIDEGAELAADKYFSTKIKKARKVAISRRAQRDGA